MRNEEKTTAAKKKIKSALAAIVFAAAICSLPNRADAWVANGNVWPGSHPRIPYYISDNLDGHIPYDGVFTDAITAMNNASTEWNNNGGSEFKFSYMGTTSVNTVADDGINAIIYVSGSSPHGAGNKAWITYHQSGGVMHGFDIELFEKTGVQNIVINYSKKATPLPWDTDLWSLILHEMGHAQGLDHSQYVSVVMDTGCGNGCSLRYLLNDDKLGTQNVNGVYTDEGLVPSTTSPAHGTTLTLNLNYPEAAGKTYVVLLTLSGMVPYSLYNITPEDSRYVPIDVDFFPTELFPTIFQNFVGFLDANGHAVATVNIPNLPTLAGLHLYFSAATLDGQYLTGVEDVGVGVDVRVI